MEDQEIEKHIKALEELQSDMDWSSDEAFNRSMDDIKTDPVKKEIWANGAAAKIAKLRKGTVRDPEAVNRMVESLTNDIRITEEELINAAREDLISDIGAYHRKYKESELSDEELLKSEAEAILDVKKDFYTTVAKGRVKNIGYDGEEGVGVSYEARNYNQYSTPINSMSDEDRGRIQRNAALNIHAAEDAIGYKDIRTKLVNDKIEFEETYSEEESKRRFKFTRENVVENDIPMCKFFINDELLYTMDVEAAARTVSAVKLEYNDMVEQGIDSMNPVERLCYEITRKTGVQVDPFEVYDYLESGYLINSKE